MWEPIWYFKKCKTPENTWQPEICIRFSHSIGDEMCYSIKTEEKNLSNSPYHSSVLDSGKIVQTRITPMKNQIYRQNSMALSLIFSTQLDEILPDIDKVSEEIEP